MSKTAFVVVALSAVAGAAGTAVAQASITPIPKPAGFQSYNSMSDDGRIVAGFVFPSGEFRVGPEYATIWTAERGLSICPDPTIRFSLEVVGISGSRGVTQFTSDGQYALAHRVVPVPGQTYSRYRPVKVRLADWGIIDLPDAPDGAIGMSKDGRTIVGNHTFDYVPATNPFVPNRSWIWREGQGATDIVKPGDAIVVRSLSADGRTMVGAVQGGPEAYRWRDGVASVIRGPEPLVGVDGANFYQSRNGRVAVTTIYNPNSTSGDLNAILYEDGTWESIVPYFMPSLGGRLQAIRITDAGDRVMLRLTPLDGSSSKSYVWDRALGLLSFESFVTQFGVTLPAGFSNWLGGSMSPDGTHFLARGTDASGAFERFQISIPSPSVMGLAGLGLIAAARRRRRRVSDSVSWFVVE